MTTADRERRRQAHRRDADLAAHTLAGALAPRLQRVARMQTAEQRSHLAASAACDDDDDAPDVATALCYELHQPLTYLLASLDRAHDELKRSAARGRCEQPALRVAHCLADAHGIARHLLHVVADVQGHARAEPRRTRRLDVRAALRAAAAMVQPADGAPPIALDAPEPAWVDGVDTRLVHVFGALFADALADDVALVARVCTNAGDVVVEIAPAPSDDDDAAAPRRAHAVDQQSSALERAVVRHIVTAHGGRLERWPACGAAVRHRVTLPAARRIQCVTSE